MVDSPQPCCSRCEARLMSEGSVLNTHRLVLLFCGLWTVDRGPPSLFQLTSNHAVVSNEVRIDWLQAILPKKHGNLCSVI